MLHQANCCSTEIFIKKIADKTSKEHCLFRMKVSDLTENEYTQRKNSFPIMSTNTDPSSSRSCDHRAEHKGKEILWEQGHGPHVIFSGSPY